MTRLTDVLIESLRATREEVERLLASPCVVVLHNGDEVLDVFRDAEATETGFVAWLDD